MRHRFWIAIITAIFGVSSCNLPAPGIRGHHDELADQHQQQDAGAADLIAGRRHVDRLGRGRLPGRGPRGVRGDEEEDHVRDHRDGQEQHACPEEPPDQVLEH